MLALLTYIIAILPSYLTSTEDEQKPRWVDWLDPDDQDMDIFFDRLLIMTYEESADVKRYLAPAVAITNARLLTSFNPFRGLVESLDDFKKVKVGVLRERTITDWQKVAYNIDYVPLVCGREVYPGKLAHWHDTNSTLHSPMHDLMVLRVARLWSDERNYKLPYNHSFDYYEKKGASTKPAGPIVTFFANSSDILGREVKFASLGFKDEKHISDSCFLRSVQFKTDDNALENCDEWLPREWGYFICIKNTADFKGIGSGAMLFYDEKLYGVGSFFLQRGDKSVLVFTDVRPYRALIMRACGDGEYSQLGEGKQLTQNWGNG